MWVLPASVMVRERLGRQLFVGCLKGRGAADKRNQRQDKGRPELGRIWPRKARNWMNLVTTGPFRGRTSRPGTTLGALRTSNFGSTTSKQDGGTDFQRRASRGRFQATASICGRVVVVGAWVPSETWGPRRATTGSSRGLPTLVLTTRPSSKQQATTWQARRRPDDPHRSVRNTPMFVLARGKSNKFAAARGQQTVTKQAARKQLAKSGPSSNPRFTNLLTTASVMLEFRSTPLWPPVAHEMFGRSGVELGSTTEI